MAKSLKKTPKVTQTQFVEVRQNARHLYLTKLPARVLCAVAYAAVRGQDDEVGAVQRLFNPKRIESIKDFTLAGGDYPNCMVLNWVNKEDKILKKDGKLVVPVQPRSAQIIDGQHRIEGLREAIQEDTKIGDLEVPVALYEYLDTKACADIFLSINTEQKPVARSLVFDLYGVASEHVVDQAAVRAKDIAEALNTEAGSPYFDLIRFPGPKKMLGVDLSTVVTALKPLAESKGNFEQVGLNELARQIRVIQNFFNVLKGWYGANWENKNNVFMNAAGFSGAIDLLKNRLIPHCNIKRSYTMDTMRAALRLENQDLVLREAISGLQGRAAVRKVSELLAERFIPAEQNVDIEV